MTVQTALRFINRFLAENDSTTTAILPAWVRAWKDGKFGEANTIARAKGTSVWRIKALRVILNK